MELILSLVLLLLHNADIAITIGKVRHGNDSIWLVWELMMIMMMVDIVVVQIVMLGNTTMSANLNMTIEWGHITM